MLWSVMDLVMLLLLGCLCSPAPTLLLKFRICLCVS
jgi:hypothetical protein